MEKQLDTPGVYTYAPGVKENPIRTRGVEGNWVGVGAAIKVVPHPPKIPYVVPEATQADLHFIYNNGGYEKIIIFTPKVVPAAVKNVPPIQKSDT